LHYIKKIDLTLFNLRILWLTYEELKANFAKQQGKVFEYLGVDPSLAAPMDKTLSDGIELLQPVGIWKDYFSEENKLWYNEYAAEAIKITQDFHHTIS